MRIFFFLIFILIQPGCTSIEVAKEVTRATSSIKTSVNKIIKTEENTKKINVNSINIEESNEIDDTLEIEKQALKVEKEKEKTLVKQQKKIIEINFLGKTISELKSSLGEPKLIRLDGNTQTARFDTNTCRLFLFFNTIMDNPRVEHFEMRNINGNLINSKEKIKGCYKDLNLT